MGFGVWGLGFGVGVWGFGVWGLGFMLYGGCRGLIKHSGPQRVSWNDPQINHQ